jgi:uncharacterized lipoprotein YehR (DUF1307 family)
MIAAGLFMVACASLKSQFIIYRLMVARSRILWGEKVHRFHQVAGILVIVFGASVAFGLVDCSKKEEPNEVQDVNAVRAELREQVERGKLTREEAIVRLAEARVEYGSKKKDADRKLSPELEAYGNDLKERVAKSEMTAEEAIAAWEEAARKAKTGSDSE